MGRGEFAKGGVPGKISKEKGCQMILKPQQVPFLARKIALALLDSKLVTFPQTMEKAQREIEEILMDDVEWEREIEEKAREILEEKEEEEGYAFYSVDRRELFRMIKQRLAKEEGFPTRFQERWDDLSLFMVKELWDKELIDYDVHDGKVKNVIFRTIVNFLNRDKEIRAKVYEKLENYKRKLIPGSEEYDLIFQQLYEQELKKHGII